MAFNPWNHSDQNQLVAQLFKQISAELKRHYFYREGRASREDPRTIRTEFASPLSKLFQMTRPCRRYWRPEQSLSKAVGAVGDAVARIAITQSRKTWDELNPEGLKQELDEAAGRAEEQDNNRDRRH